MERLLTEDGEKTTRRLHLRLVPKINILMLLRQLSVQSFQNPGFNKSEKM
jgi:hypothetical protein